MFDRYGQFVNRSAHIAIAQGRRPVQWNEVWDHFTTALPKQSIVDAPLNASLFVDTHLTATAYRDAFGAGACLV